MASLASNSAMGYYPTATKSIKKVLDKTVIFPEEKTVTILDSCAGEGDAIEFIAKEYNCSAYAIELNKYRAQKIAQKDIVTELLNADALNDVRKSNSWVGLNFLNPPYGTLFGSQRLEEAFAFKYGTCTAKGGLLLLVVGSSAVEIQLARTLRRQGYYLHGCFFDEESQDYRDYQQRFILLQRIDYNFRDEVERMMELMENPVNIDDVDSFEKIVVKTGIKPNLFKEHVTPDWKIVEDTKNSKIEDRFFGSIKRTKFSTSSIEHPNEGQSAILIASGALNKKITLEDGTHIILKGSSKKITTEIVTELPKGNDVKGLMKLKESYKTTVIGLNLTEGEFVKYED